MKTSAKLPDVSQVDVYWQVQILEDGVWTARPYEAPVYSYEAARWILAGYLLKGVAGEDCMRIVKVTVLNVYEVE